MRTTYDTIATKLNTLQFKTGVIPAEIVLRQVFDIETGGAALEVAIASTNDKITFNGLFNSYQNNPYVSVQQFIFADGTVWNMSTILSTLFAGTAGVDSLVGTMGADSLNGQAGNDILYGRSGNDTFDGGADNDQIYGENGNDTLNGGGGNDTLDGGTGNDTYLFLRGFNTKIISDFDSSTENVDVLSIGQNITTDQLWFRRVGADLEISLIGTTDKATIRNWYSGNAYHIEQFKTFDDKTLLDTQVDTLVSAMSSFIPPVIGQTILPTDYQLVLIATINENWHY